MSQRTYSSSVIPLKRNCCFFTACVSGMYTWVKCVLSLFMNRVYLIFDNYTECSILNSSTQPMPFAIVHHSWSDKISGLVFCSVHAWLTGQLRNRKCIHWRELVLNSVAYNFTHANLKCYVVCSGLTNCISSSLLTTWCKIRVLWMMMSKVLHMSMPKSCCVWT